MTATREQGVPPHQCLALLDKPRIGRIVYTSRAMPAVTPVRLVLDGEVVVVGSFADPAVVTAAAGSIVALQVDDLDPVSGDGWSLTLTGQAAEQADPGERLRLLRLPGFEALDGRAGLLLVVPMLCDIWRTPATAQAASSVSHRTPVQRDPGAAELPTTADQG